MMSQIQPTKIHVCLLSVFLTLNACSAFSFPSNAPQLLNNPGLSPIPPNVRASELPVSSSMPTLPSSTPAPVLKEQNTDEMPSTKKFEKMAQFFDTSDPHLPFVLFYDENMKQSQLYTESGDAMVGYFQALLKKKPGNPEVIFDLSTAYLLAGKPEKTLELTKSFNDSSSPALSAQYNRLLALLKMEKFTEINQPIQQLYDFSKKSGTYTQSESLYVYMAQIALDSYSSLEYVMDPTFIKNVYDYQLKSNNDKFLALTLYKRYSRYYNKLLIGNYLPEFEQAIKLNPSSALYKSAYARELLLQNRFEAAQKVLEEAIELNPHSANIHLTMAQLYQAESKPEEMIVQAFEKVQALAPKWELPTTLLSDYYFEKRKFKESAETLKKFLNKTTLSMNFIHLKLANALFYSGNYQDAIFYYNLYNSVFTFEDLEVNLMRGKAYGLLKTSEGRSRAIADFTTVVERSPKPVPTQTANISESRYWRALNDRAILYFEDGQFQKCYEDLITLLQLAPNSNDLKYNLTGALGELARYDEAIRIGLEIPETYAEIKAVYRNISYAYAYSVKCEESEKYAKLAGVEPKPCKPPGFTFAP